jgi:hypothetical protein
MPLKICPAVIPRSAILNQPFQYTAGQIFLWTPPKESVFFLTDPKQQTPAISAGVLQCFSCGHHTFYKWNFKQSKCKPRQDIKLLTPAVFGSAYSILVIGNW